MTHCPPPRRFRPVGELQFVEVARHPPAFTSRPRRRSARSRQGIRYEERAHEHFAEVYGERYVPGMWLKFMCAGEPVRWCQPDGLIVRPEAGRITILEMKYTHTSDAWWQLKFLYLPTLRWLFPEKLWSFSVCEVVKWYDPAIAFPERVKMAVDPEVVMPGEFGVHIWKP